MVDVTKSHIHHPNSPLQQGANKQQRGSMRSNPPSTIHHPTSAWLMVGLCVLSLWHAPVEAANYYVATNGSNTNSGTSLASPFLTIQQAANVAQAGDNVYVRGGTYRETVTVANSGTSSAPITFQPYQNEDVTVTGLDPTQQRLDASTAASICQQQQTRRRPARSSSAAIRWAWPGGPMPATTIRWWPRRPPPPRQPCSRLPRSRRSPTRP